MSRLLRATTSPITTPLEILASTHTSSPKIVIGKVRESKSKEQITMTRQPRKMSELMMEMAERLLRHSDADHSSEAAHVALMFANIAWNETVGLGYAREGYRSAWEMIEAENPEMWSEFKSNDIEGMIDELVEYKQKHFPDDRRRILTCGIPDGKIRVEWLPAVAPGVDSKWEMQLHGLVRTGEREQAIEFLRETRRLSRQKAAKQVKKIAAYLGLV